MCALRTSPIPDPRLRLIDNQTPFAMVQADKMGPGRRFFDTVVLKGAFELTPDRLTPAGPAPIRDVDEFWDPDAPERSSLRAAGDVVVCKPTTDVIVTGSARAPNGEPATQWDVAVVLRDDRETLVKYAARVTGPRQWEHRVVRGWVLSPPSSTVDVPIRYELAYGGSYFIPGDDTWRSHAENPSGRGFCDLDALNPRSPMPAPQWQLASEPVTGLNRAVAVAGLGPVPRHWPSRQRYAGTYDAAWTSRMHADVARGLPPDYAADFDLRMFQCAMPGLISRRHVRGDERLGLGGLVGGRGELLTALPGIAVDAELVTLFGDTHEARLPLDTVHIDLDAQRAYLSWRLTLDHARNVVMATLKLSEGGPHA